MTKKPAPRKPPVKVVEYAYKTSTFATKLGFPKVGCWYVLVRGDSRLGRLHKGFATKEEALAHAETLPYLYGPWSHTPSGVTDGQGRLRPKESML